jgi:hypothetical protein
MMTSRQFTRERAEYGRDDDEGRAGDAGGALAAGGVAVEAVLAAAVTEGCTGDVLVVVVVADIVQISTAGY